MTDEKKPPAFDPDKTMVDVRPPSQPQKPPPADADRTAVHQRPATPPPPPSPPLPRFTEESEKTMVSAPPPPPARQAPQADADRTIIGGPPVGAMDQTQVGGFTPPTPAASGPVKFELICLAGPGRGRKFALRGTQNLVGSAPTCQVVIPGIEGVHAKFQETAEGVEITNLGTDGSIITGGRKPARAMIHSGDLLKLGDVVLRFVRAGDVFSSDYSEDELKTGGIGQLLDPEMLKKNWKYGAIGLLVLVMVAVIWPVAQQAQAPQEPKGPSASDVARGKQIDSLLQLGETLFNAGKYVAPPDQPESDNAYAKFNDVLLLDPGNERAREWLTKIDKKLEEEKGKREEAEKAKLAAAQEARDRQRKALEGRVRELIEKGDELYNAGQVAEPAGRNALVFYREALKVDDQSVLAKAAIAKAIQYYVGNGDKLRASGDSWKALEQFRKASRATEGKEPEIEARVKETETQLRSGMASSDAYLVMFKDDRGQVVVFDDMDKVPARYRDRAVEIRPQKPGQR